MIGKKITTLQEIYDLSLRRVAVCSYRRLYKHIPAAFVIGMPAKTVLHMINEGLYEYVSVLSVAIDTSGNTDAKEREDVEQRST